MLPEFTNNEFHNWLLEHDNHFKTYTLHEIGELAIHCGFDNIMVRQWVYREKFQRAKAS